MSNTLLRKGLTSRTSWFCLSAALALLALLTSVASGATQWPKADSPDDSTTKSLVAADDSEDLLLEDASATLERVKEFLQNAEEAYQQALEADRQDAKVEKVDVAQAHIDEAIIILDKLSSDKDIETSAEYSKLLANVLSLERKCEEILAMYGLIAFSPPEDPLDDYEEVVSTGIEVDPDEPSDEDSDADLPDLLSLPHSFHGGGLTLEISDESDELDESTIGLPDGIQDEFAPIETLDVDSSAECSPSFQPTVAPVAPRGFGHYLRVLGEVFYSPKHEGLTPEERASYDYTLCPDETKFEFVCRLLKEQRESRPRAFWSFWALLLALIVFCFARRCKRRAASATKEVTGASEAREDAATKGKE